MSTENTPAPIVPAGNDRRTLACDEMVCGLSFIVATAPALCSAGDADDMTEREATVATARILTDQLRGEYSQGSCLTRRLLRLAIIYDRLDAANHRQT